MVLFSSAKSWANVRYCDYKCMDIWGMKKVGEKINEPRAHSVALSLLFYFLPLGPLCVFVFFLLLIMTYSREVYFHLIIFHLLFMPYSRGILYHSCYLRHSLKSLPLLPPGNFNIRVFSFKFTFLQL